MGIEREKLVCSNSTLSSMSTLLPASLVCLCLALQTAALTGDPFTPGPHPVKHQLYNRFLNNGLNHELDVWAPASEGTFPVLYFMAGLGGIVPGVAYTTVMQHIASHGIAVLYPWALISNPGDNYEGEWLVEVQDWVEEHLVPRLQDDGWPAGFQLDHDSLLLGGHSAGGHIAVGYLTHHCNKVKGSVLLSPVDGFDPFGLIPNFVITPGTYLNYDTPTLVLMAGLDNTPGSHIIGDTTPSCAPDDLSNTRFYDAMPGQAWLVNNTQFGHGDLLDEFYYNAMTAIHFCGTDKSQDRELYRAVIAGTIVSFSAAVLDNQCEALQYIEDADMTPVDSTTITKSSVTGSAWSCNTESFCNWQEEPFPI